MPTKNIVHLCVNFETRQIYVHANKSKVEEIYREWREQCYDCALAVADAEED